MHPSLRSGLRWLLPLQLLLPVGRSMESQRSLLLLFRDSMISSSRQNAPSPSIAETIPVPAPKFTDFKRGGALQIFAPRAFSYEKQQYSQLNLARVRSEQASARATHRSTTVAESRCLLRSCSRHGTCHRGPTLHGPIMASRPISHCHIFAPKFCSSGY